MEPMYRIMTVEVALRERVAAMNTMTSHCGGSQVACCMDGAGATGHGMAGINSMDLRWHDLSCRTGCVHGHQGRQLAFSPRHYILLTHASTDANPTTVSKPRAFFEGI
jgi:hypothetical protein